MDPLVYEQFINDPRYKRAKKLLIEALSSYQKKITEIKPQNPKREEDYLERIHKFGEQRGTPLYFSYLGSGIGNGALVELYDGSVKYDLISGIGPHFFGHGFLGLTEEVIDGALSDIIMQGNLQQNVIATELVDLLLKVSKMDRCFLTSSGAMAGENALKICFQKNHPARRILAFEHCFIGRSTTLSQITDRPQYREGIPLNTFVDYIPFFDYRAPEESTEKAIAILRQHIARYPRQYAAMCFELVQGEGGFYPGTKEFFTKVMKVLRKAKILIWIDEIQTFARTEELFAFQYFGLEQYVDVVTIGKASQVCATLYQKHITPRTGLLSQTFTASSTALYGCLYIIQYLLENNMYGPSGKIATIHKLFVNELEKLQEKYPSAIEGPFGIGAMLALTPLGGKRKTVSKFVHRLFDNGIIAFLAGGSPTRVRFLLPSVVLEESDIKKISAIIEKTIKEFL